MGTPEGASLKSPDFALSPRLRWCDKEIPSMCQRIYPSECVLITDSLVGLLPKKKKKGFSPMHLGFSFLPPC
jgi:hypothetical protein